MASLHDAALDDSHWPAASAVINEACGAKGNFLVTGDGESQDDIQIFFARFCLHGRRRPDLERLYFETYHGVDESAARIRQLPDSRIVHVSSLYTEDEMKASVVYNEALPGADIRDGLCVRLDGPRRSRIAWAIADPVDGDGWTSDRVGMIERVLPHLRQFVRVRQALVDARALGSSDAALLENPRCGALQLDPRGQIVAANDRARNLLRAGRGLADPEGRLRAAAPEDDDRLQKLLAAALPPFGGQGASGSMLVRSGTRGPQLVLHACPVGPAVSDARPSAVAALVLVADVVGRASIDPGRVAAVLGLSPAESGVAAALAEGGSIADIALTTGRTEGTVRWHLKRIFAKLRLSRQLDLVKLVLSVANIPQAPH